MSGSERGGERDPYRVLGVPADASADEISRAYRRRAREVHPDLNTGRDARAFQELTEAYELVGDPISRARCDATRARAGGPRSIQVPVRVARRAAAPRYQVMCRMCRGRGEVAHLCGACRGAGMHLRRAGPISLGVPCRACGGRGHVVVLCAACRGRGSLTSSARWPSPIASSTP